MHGKSLFQNLQSPKPDTFVGTLIVENNEATGGTMKSWVSSVAEASGVYTITFIAGITFPVTPVVVLTPVSTNATPVRVYGVITQQYTNATRTLKYKLLIDDNSGGTTAATAADDLFTNITLVCPLTGGI